MSWIDASGKYYNPEVVKCPVWAKEFKRTGKPVIVYLQDAGSFTFTVSAGANSDYSYTGCFYQSPVKTVEQAQQILDEYIPIWLSQKSCSTSKAGEIAQRLFG